VSRATGDLLLFFDAADLPKTPDFVATLVRALHRSDADCLTCACDTVDADTLLALREELARTMATVGGLRSWRVSAPGSRASSAIDLEASCVLDQAPGQGLGSIAWEG
jgi:hypothetical protein